MHGLCEDSAVQCAAPQAFSTKMSQKTSVTQEFAATSGVPLAFCKQLERFVIFCHKSASASGMLAELQCIALHCVVSH